MYVELTARYGVTTAVITETVGYTDDVASSGLSGSALRLVWATGREDEPIERTMQPTQVCAVAVHSTMRTSRGCCTATQIGRHRAHIGRR